MTKRNENSFTPIRNIIILERIKSKTIISLNQILFCFLFLIYFSLLCHGAEVIRMAEFGKDVFADKTHNEAVEKIIKEFGLSSTGNIYFSSKFKSLIDIKAFCVMGDEIFEYRTSHFFDCLSGIYWFNPIGKRIFVLFSIDQNKGLKKSE